MSEQVYSFDVTILDQLPLDSDPDDGVFLTPYGWNGQPLSAEPLSVRYLISNQYFAGGRPYWEAHVCASLPMYRPAGSVKELDEEDRAYAEARILAALGEPQSYRVHRLPR